ncbi:MAG: hypothetical protein ACRDJ5_00310, partial [Actinomycetota bacterium]
MPGEKIGLAMIEQPRARGSRTRSGLFSWVACLLAAFILTACAGPQFRYARHPDTNTYFRIPSDWALLEGDEVAMASAGTLSPQQEAQVRAATRWMVTFQSPAPSGDSEVPRIQGFARIRTIDDERIRENLSLNFLRNDLVPIDVLE